MVETARRARVDDEGRGTPVAEWEVFVRDDESGPMRHVGSVAAAGATEAHEHATRLFGWYAVDVWICPAEAVERYSTRPLTASSDADDADTDAASDSPGGGTGKTEPRVYEETEGTPEVNDR